MTDPGDDIGRALSEAGRLFHGAFRLLAGEADGSVVACRSALDRAGDPGATVLVAGLRSTGKSSLVSSLWGDSDLLPTAVRDCTQTNTLIRAPREGEGDRRLFLHYLTREGGEEFAARGLAFHRLREVIAATLGPMGPKLDEPAAGGEGTAGARVRLAVDTVRRLFSEREDVHVIHEPATEQLEQLEQFLAHLDSPEYVPGGCVEKDWTERREYLMGRRRRDGRTLDVGKLLSLRLVEIVRATDRWGGLAPAIIDTPWVPAFHNARRADLVLREAERADIIVITALPEPFEFEPWVLEAFDRLPRLRGRTLVVFNQIDTIDTSCLFARGGFAETWARNVERLGVEGIGTENIFVSCARLPFLEGLRVVGTPAPAETAREDRLRAVLGEIRRLLLAGPAGRLAEKLVAACDPTDCGVEALRARLAGLMMREVRLDRAREACDAILAVNVLGLGAGREVSSGDAGSQSGAGGWPKVRARATDLLGRIRTLAPGASSRQGKGGRRSPMLGDGRPLFRD